jgi:hypothetical protein
MFMRFVLFLTSLVGTAFFALLPIYAPPVVLQAEEVSRFLMGLVATVCAGLAQGLVDGRSRGMPLVLACTFVGSSFKRCYQRQRPWRSSGVCTCWPGAGCSGRVPGRFSRRSARRRSAAGRATPAPRLAPCG